MSIVTGLSTKHILPHVGCFYQLCISEYGILTITLLFDTYAYFQNWKTYKPIKNNNKNIKIVILISNKKTVSFITWKPRFNGFEWKNFIKYFSKRVNCKYDL